MQRMNRKCLIFLMTAALTTVLIMIVSKPKNSSYYRVIELKNYLDNMSITTRGVDVEKWRQITNETYRKMSTLGRILYLGEDYPKAHDKVGNYEILVWKYGKTIENRHLKRFGSNKRDPFEGCRVRNCKITYEESAAHSADLIIFHLHRMKATDDLPKSRKPSQIWTFLTDESPHHTFMSKNHLANYNNVFNWSMTYRMDSDIPVPYGRAVPKTHSDGDGGYVRIVKKRDVLVAILGSNCGGKNNRWDYVRELQKHIQVDVYGGCGTLKTCPGHFTANCHDIDSYLFYLAFENSNCDEYITEKLWWNAYEKNSIPVVMGSSRHTYKRLLPPHSYLNVDNYAHPKDLAVHMRYLNETGNYLEYFQWRQHYNILNEHGYFGSQSWHYCRVCEALNYNNKTSKTYACLKSFWNSTRDCHPAWNSAN